MNNARNSLALISGGSVRPEPLPPFPARRCEPGPHWPGVPRREPCAWERLGGNMRNDDPRSQSRPILDACSQSAGRNAGGGQGRVEYVPSGAVTSQLRLGSATALRPGRPPRGRTAVVRRRGRSHDAQLVIQYRPEAGSRQQAAGSWRASAGSPRCCSYLLTSQISPPSLSGVPDNPSSVRAKK